MIDLKRALKAFLGNKQELDWKLDSPDTMMKKNVYNAALDDTLYFLGLIESGNLTEEFIVELERQQGSK